MPNEIELERKKFLINMIIEAFSAVLYPGDDKILIDSTGLDLESNQIADVFRGKKWNEILLDDLRRHHKAVFFFTPEAYRYYLPAYLRATLQHYKRAGTIPFTVVFSLTPPQGQGNELVKFQHKMEEFTKEQQNVIKEFLKYLSEIHHASLDESPPQIALNRYWGK